MSLRSIRENRRFGTSFMPVGGVEAEISKMKKIGKVHFGDINILASTPPNGIYYGVGEINI